MITVLDRRSRPGPPPWLEGARDLASIVGRDGILWTCAEPGLVTSEGWQELPDGYAVAGRFEPADLLALRRGPGPYQVASAMDLRGWEWAAPVVCNDDGERAFAVAYGDDWLPAMTPEQERAMAIVTEARLVFARQLDDPNAPGFPMQAACAWVAELLGLSYHLSPSICARCGLLDDFLLTSVLQASANLPTLRVDRSS